MRTKFCPKCESKNIRINISRTAALGLPQKWKCEDCGFESFMIMEKRRKK